MTVAAEPPWDGAQTIVEALRRYGVRVMFGNPGSTELPLLARLAQDVALIEFVLCLHEDIAVATAIGYAEVTGEPVAVQAHTAAGLMHALTNLESANALHIPIIVLVGQQDTRFLAADPPLAGDIVSIARPHVKWAWEPGSAGALPKVVHRAVTTALAPPRGPVVVSIPVNLLAEPCAPPLEPLTTLTPPAPSEAAVEAASRRLTQAQRPLVVVGDGVASEDGVEAVVRFAEALAAPVVTDRMSARANFPSSHPLFEGLIGRSGRAMEARVRSADVVVAIGCDSLIPLLYDGGLADWPGDLVVFAADVDEVSKGPPATTTVLGSLATSLTRVTSSLPRRASQAAKPRPRVEPRLASPADAPLTLDIVAATLDRDLPDDTLLVEEAVSGKYALLQEYRYDPPRRLLGAKTGGLGVGVGAAIGAALGARGRFPVIGITGDGSLLYYPQALWTATHAGADVTIVVLNNRGYAVLYDNLRLFGISSSTGVGRYFDVVDPAVDFEGLARAFGATAVTVSTAGDFAHALARAVPPRGVTVIDAQLSENEQ